MRTLAALVIVLAVVAPAAAQDAPTFEVKEGKLVLPSPVEFDIGKAKLKASSDAALAHIAAFLEAKSYISSLRIENHSDNVGDAAKNQTLSEERAFAVAKALVKKGVACERLVPVGFGATKPVADASTPEGRATNRRTEAFIAALKGRAIGGAPLDGGGKPAGDPCK